MLKIDEVKTYWKVSERPFYDEMNDEEKIEICKYSEVSTGKVERYMLKV